MNEQHPSYLALDRHALGVLAPDVGVHLAGCPSCRAHVELVQAPPVARLPTMRRPLVTPGRRLALTAALVSGLAAAAASVLLFFAPSTDVITAKGGPSVAVYVARGGQVTLWNGKEALRVGDRIELQIKAPGYDTVRVTDGANAVLYRGALRPGDNTLPLSWRIEAGDDAFEALSVTLAGSGQPDYRVDLRLPIAR